MTAPGSPERCTQQLTHAARLRRSQPAQVMREDVANSARLGANGVVLGVLTRDGDVDVAQLRDFLQLCQAQVRRACVSTQHAERYTMMDYCWHGCQHAACCAVSTMRLLLAWGIPSDLMCSMRMEEITVVCGERRVRA